MMQPMRNYITHLCSSNDLLRHKIGPTLYIADETMPADNYCNDVPLVSSSSSSFRIVLINEW